MNLKKEKTENPKREKYILEKILQNVYTFIHTKYIKGITHNN